MRRTMAINEKAAKLESKKAMSEVKTVQKQQAKAKKQLSKDSSASLALAVKAAGGLQSMHDELKELLFDGNEDALPTFEALPDVTKAKAAAAFITLQAVLDEARQKMMGTLTVVSFTAKDLKDIDKDTKEQIAEVTKRTVSHSLMQP